MTWKELKERISRMTEEEQQQEVAIWGEDFSLRNKDCLLLNADWDVYFNDEWDEAWEECELSMEELENPGTHKVLKEGMYYIYSRPKKK